MYTLYILYVIYTHKKEFQGGTSGTDPSGQCRGSQAQVPTWVRDPPGGGERATHSRYLAWEIIGQGEPGGLQSIMSKRVDTTA